MNRPRNRQPRPPRGNNPPPHHQSSRPPRTIANVPTIRQVIPGAPVSIVLKADQPTGREVQGTVQDVLTRGDHPRGIKVRLQDGRVGRVQRMDAGPSITTGVTTFVNPRDVNSSAQRQIRDHDVRGDPEGPPPRSLADFIPDLDDNDSESGVRGNTAELKSATIECPFCDSFEGDEAAVSHHVEEHLT